MIGLYFAPLWALALHAAEVKPEGNPKKHSLSLESSGSKESRSFAISLTLVTQKALEVSLSTETSRAEDFETGEDEVSSRYFSLGVTTDPDKDFYFGAGLSQWGLKSEFTKKALGLELGWNLNDWSFSLKPEFSRMSLKTDVGIENDLNFNAHGGRFRVENFSFEPMSFFFEVEGQKYSEDITLLASDWASSFFSITSLDLSYSLIDSSVALGGKYDFTAWSLGLELSRTQMAMDDSESQQLSLISDVTLNPQWSLSLEVGSSTFKPEAGGEDRAGFLALGVSYFFGPTP